MAINLLNKTLTLERQRALGLGHVKKLRALEVVESGQSVKRKLLGFRKDGQSLVTVAAHDFLAVKVTETVKSQRNLSIV